MKDRPILSSTPMVRALLEGRKTQTRRVVKPQPKPSTHTVTDLTTAFPDEPWCALAHWLEPDGSVMDFDKASEIHGAWPDCSKQFACPYGKPGDRLWVRESIIQRPLLHLLTGEPISGTSQAAYAADDEDVCNEHGFQLLPWWKGKRGLPSIHMPRWASRITLEITEVRVQRLQEISVRDAIAEGCEPLPPFPASVCAPEDYIPGYRKLWESINGVGSWSLNPWVWAVSFKEVA